MLNVSDFSLKILRTNKRMDRQTDRPKLYAQDQSMQGYKRKIENS